MKKKAYRLLCLICAFVVLLSVTLPPVRAYEGYSSKYAYTLNDSILNCGVISSDSAGGFIGVNAEAGVFPNGVIYADLVRFTNEAEECLVIFRSAAAKGCVSADIYKYNPTLQSAELLTSVERAFDIASNKIYEMGLGYNDKNRFIVCNEYTDGVLANAKYYTVIDGDAFIAVDSPESTGFAGVVTFNGSYLHPEVDVSYYNKYLTEFFSKLKESSANSIELDNLVGDITDEEQKRLELVLKKTTGFREFDIGDYATMAEYALEVKKHDGEGQFNAITHVYDLGDGMYYVRYSTDLCFYNGTILRRTDALADKYQILCVRNDFIPFSMTELDSLKEAYMKNKLVLQRSLGQLEIKDKPVIKLDIFETEKKLDIPRVIPKSYRLPVAIIGGGVCLLLVVLLLAYILSDRNN